MKHTDAIVTMSIDMYLSNLSSRKMRNQLRRHFDLPISHVSILDWVRKYVLVVQKYVNRFKPQMGGQYYADETEIRCGPERHRFWVTVDWPTRFIPTIHYSLTGNIKEAHDFLSKMRLHALPKYVQTDAAQFYPWAFTKVFPPGCGVEHRINNVALTKKHNVRIETVFAKIKDRVIDFRGLKALWSAPILLAGIILQHNYIEAHTTTHRIPCESVNLSPNIGSNRWHGLIRTSAAVKNFSFFAIL